MLDKSLQKLLSSPRLRLWRKVFVFFPLPTISHHPIKLFNGNMCSVAHVNIKQNMFSLWMIHTGQSFHRYCGIVTFKGNTMQSPHLQVSAVLQVNPQQLDSVRPPISTLQIPTSPQWNDIPCWSCAFSFCRSPFHHSLLPSLIYSPVHSCYFCTKTQDVPLVSTAQIQWAECIRSQDVLPST